MSLLVGRDDNLGSTSVYFIHINQQIGVTLCIVFDILCKRMIIMYGWVGNYTCDTRLSFKDIRKKRCGF